MEKWGKIEKMAGKNAGKTVKKRAKTWKKIGNWLKDFNLRRILPFYFFLAE